MGLLALIVEATSHLTWDSARSTGCVCSLRGHAARCGLSSLFISNIVALS